jgi:hypothetical protein
MPPSTARILFDRYGVRLDFTQLADVLGLGVGRLRSFNAGFPHSAQVLPIKSYKAGGRRFVDFRDLAAYLDRCPDPAATFEAKAEWARGEVLQTVLRAPTRSALVRQAE